MARYVIDHERYGTRTEFTDPVEAEEAIRSCGPEFKHVTLVFTDGFIVDQDGEPIGFYN